jgi:hypothetical protein
MGTGRHEIIALPESSTFFFLHQIVVPAKLRVSRLKVMMIDSTQQDVACRRGKEKRSRAVEQERWMIETHSRPMLLDRSARCRMRRRGKGCGREKEGLAKSKGQKSNGCLRTL